MRSHSHDPGADHAIDKRSLEERASRLRQPTSTRPTSRCETPTPSTGTELRPSAAGGADVLLLSVIAATFLPVGLLVIAAEGGGLPAVALAFVVLVLITAAVTTLIRRAADEASSDDP